MRRITYRELLNMIAEGNPPKTVKYQGHKYIFDGKDYFDVVYGQHFLSTAISKRLFMSTMVDTPAIEIKEEILDEVEKQYIKSALVPLKVEKVKKTDLGDIERLTYRVSCTPEFEIPRQYSLPAFKKGAMYKGMESEKWYTIKELLK